MNSAVIVDIVRTPLGRRNGKLKDWHPVDLAAETLKALQQRTGVDPGLVDDVVMGCVMQVGEQAVNVGRNAVLAAGWPAERVAWMEDPGRLGPPDGENGEAIAARAGAFLRDLAAWDAAQTAAGDTAERRVLAVGHSTLNRVLLTVALGVPTSDYRRRFRQDWLNLTVLRLDGGAPDGAEGRGLLLLANDAAHLRVPGSTPWP